MQYLHFVIPALVLALSGIGPESFLYRRSRLLLHFLTQEGFPASGNDMEYGLYYESGLQKNSLLKLFKD
jgi:hypothetical protein